MTTVTQVSMTEVNAIIIASDTARKQLMLKNTGSNTVYIGKSASVSASTNNASGGYPIMVGETLYLHDYSGIVYGICGAGLSSTISVIGQ